MGRYNFDQIVDRKHTKSLKYDFAVQRGKPAFSLVSLSV